MLAIVRGREFPGETEVSTLLPAVTAGSHSSGLSLQVSPARKFSTATEVLVDSLLESVNNACRHSLRGHPSSTTGGRLKPAKAGFCAFCA